MGKREISDCWVKQLFLRRLVCAACGCMTPSRGTIRQLQLFTVRIVAGEMICFIFSKNGNSMFQVVSLTGQSGVDNIFNNVISVLICEDDQKL